MASPATLALRVAQPHITAANDGRAPIRLQCLAVYSNGEERLFAPVHHGWKSARHAAERIMGDRFVHHVEYLDA